MQDAFFCGCGASSIFALGRCSRCYRQLRLSRDRFGGLREQVLLRDGRQCLGCGELGTRLLIVHHRRPGVHRLPLLLTLCRRCHVRIHHTWRPAAGFPEFLRALWREQHPELAEQLELQLVSSAIAAAGPIHQVSLFDAA